MFRTVRIIVGLLTTGIVSLALGMVFIPSPTAAQEAKTEANWKDVVPEAELTKLIEESAKKLQAATKTEFVFTQAGGSKKSPNNDVQNEAYIVALFAQGGMKQTEGDMAKKYAAVRDAALSLADAAAGQKLAEAQKQVAIIASFPKTIAPAADAKELPLTKVAPLPNLMKQVNALDGRFMKDFKKGRLLPADFTKKGFAEDLALASEKMAAFTMAITAHVPAKEEKDKPKKHWIESAAEVRAATLAMTKAAQAKNPMGFRTAFSDMQSACTKCHDKFREVDE